MKSFLLSTLAALCGLLSIAPAHAASFRTMGWNDSRMVLVIKSDGSCVLTNAAVELRKTAEMQVAAWERYAQMSDAVSELPTPGDEETPPATPPQPAKAPEPKALSNAELAAKLSELAKQNPEFGENSTYQIENIEGNTNSIRVTAVRTFASLKDLLSQSPYTWGPNVLMFEDAHLELDTNRNLRLTFTATPESSRYAKTLTRDWKSMKVKFEWKLVLPGKILSSGLPQTQETTTWLSVDSDKPETLDAALKLVGSPLVITAEAAGLQLDAPLESRKLVQSHWRRRNAEPELPITDAGPGFVAEPASIALGTIHYFPEGEKYFKDQADTFRYGMGSTGAVISAKLFAPKGRIMRSVSGVRVKAAKDDQGRPIARAKGNVGDEEDGTEFTSYSSGGSDKDSSATTIELHLALPAPDAKTIEEVQAEAVALTIGGWKELVLTNVQADAKKAIDLAEVLPGAKLIIKKATAKSSQKQVEATLEGPPSVSRLEVSIKLSGARGSSSSSTSDRQSKTVGDKTTRQITVQAFEFQMDEEAKSRPLTLLIRYPQDFKRERVQFKLTALDLL